ncbi:hypothetical protein CLU79DRAFT_752491 [Phycomyces nitens]|nr:hypothetical protein CLU79DRAFT_752491 [Phycomyces nitens]
MGNSIPTEIILLILSYLSKKDTIKLLTLNHNWFNVVSKQLYNTITIQDRKELFDLHNLFTTTAKQCLNPNHGFYSSYNYAGLVRKLDFSRLDCCNLVTDPVLRALTLDTCNLVSLNLYNCHQVTNPTLRVILSRAIHIKHLFLAGATQLTGEALVGLGSKPPILQTLNVYLIPDFFSSLSSRKIGALRPVLGNLRTLKAGKLTARHSDMLCTSFQGLQELWLHGATDHQVRSILLAHRTANMISLTLKYCKLDMATFDLIPHTVRHLRYEHGPCSDYGWLHNHIQNLLTLWLTYSADFCLQYVHQARALRAFAPPCTAGICGLPQWSPLINRLILTIPVAPKDFDILMDAYSDQLVELQVVGTGLDQELKWAFPCLESLVWKVEYVRLSRFQDLPRLIPRLRVLAIGVSDEREDKIVNVLEEWKYLEVYHLRVKEPTGLEYEFEHGFEYWEKHDDVW